jgi:hypothetical protein
MKRKNRKKSEDETLMVEGLSAVMIPSPRYSRSLIEGDSIEKAIKSAKPWFDYWGDRRHELGIYLTECRVVPCCCTDAIAKRLFNSYWTKDAIAARLHRKIKVQCTCGKVFDILSDDGLQWKTTVAGLDLFVWLDPFKLCVRVWCISPLKSSAFKLRRGEQEVLKERVLNIDLEFETHRVF